ncbi:MAG: cupin domain-containing protein [Acetobacteraceae bacterium]
MSERQTSEPTAAGVAVAKTTELVRTADVRVTEYVLQPGDSHPWHHHSQVTDRFYCLEGLVGVETRAAPGKVTLRPGDEFSVPPGVIHHAGNAGDGRARYLLVQAVGMYDYIRAD